ncbi:MAG: 30S ribosomal protein S20 [Elusimicrobia bacterium]|nr:30S ribosomal protein S20 [Elusimicrobiota bacterium]
MAKLKTGRHTSAIKAWRKSTRLQARNVSVKVRIRRAVKDFNALISRKDIESARKNLTGIYSMLDKAAAKGVIHYKSAARKKSRLSRRIKAAVQK